jgi:hypothetical protein
MLEPESKNNRYKQDIKEDVIRLMRTYDAKIHSAWLEKFSEQWPEVLEGDGLDDDIEYNISDDDRVGSDEG